MHATSVDRLFTQIRRVDYVPYLSPPVNDGLFTQIKHGNSKHNQEEEAAVI